MKTSLKILILLIGLCYFPKAFGQGQQDDQLMQLLREELAYNMKELQKQENPPYYMNFRLADEKNVNITSAFGALMTSAEKHQRLLVPLFSKGIRLHLGRDERLNYSNGYYEPATNNIFFRKNFDIQENDILHELLHAIQHHIIGYSMYNLSEEKNIEYEAYVARDILECIRKNGDFSNCPAMGIPNSRLEQEYRLWIHKISVYAIGQAPETDSVIESKFNTWAKEWNSYNDKKCSETFVPLLLRYITLNANIRN